MLTARDLATKLRVHCKEGREYFRGEPRPIKEIARQAIYDPRSVMTIHWSAADRELGLERGTFSGYHAREFTRAQTELLHDAFHLIVSGVDEKEINLGDYL